MTRLVLTWIGHARHVFHGALEILYFQAVAFDASIALLVAVVDMDQWLMVFIRVNRITKQRVAVDIHAHDWARDSFSVCEYFCSHGVRALLAWSMGIHVPCVFS